MLSPIEYKGEFLMFSLISERVIHPPLFSASAYTLFELEEYLTETLIEGSQWLRRDMLEEDLMLWNTSVLYFFFVYIINKINYLFVFFFYCWIILMIKYSISLNLLTIDDWRKQIIFKFYYFDYLFYFVIGCLS